MTIIAIATPTATPVKNRDAVLATIADELSSSTQKAYAQEMKSLLSYYETNSWEFYPKSEDGSLNESLFLEQVLSYIQVLSEQGKTFSTLNKTFAAIKHYASYDNQRAYSCLFFKPAKAFMEGVARQKKAHAPKKAQALTVANLQTLYKSLNTHLPRDIRDKAVIAIGIATALRSQSLADLTLTDVSPAVSMNGLNIRLRFSKTDQTGRGVFIPVARSTRRKLDPVNALNEWLSVLAAFGYTKETTPTMALFPTVRGQRGVQNAAMAHSSIAITQMLRSRLTDVGITTEAQALAYSSHSLRATFITLSNAAGVTEKDIATISGHTDMNTLRGYDRASAEKSAQATYLNN